MLTRLKLLLRPLFYGLQQNRSFTIRQPEILNNLKWIIDQRFGRAYYKGYYEPQMVQYLTENFEDGHVFLDIGGHAGYFSYVFSRLSPNGRVLTFEPDPQNAAFIRKIIQLNNICNIRVFEAAAGANRNTLFFEKGLSSSMGKISSQGEIPILTVPIDDVCDELAQVNLIKIDVEGFGNEVLSGAVRTIKKHMPTILMELHDGSGERYALSELASCGYEFYNLDGDIEDIWKEDCRFYVAKKAGAVA